jgi:carbonic anhydrase
MKKLMAGLHHFQSQVFDSHKELFERLDAGQRPEALFITCSDSRIDPNLILNSVPGDLFILRNAGNIIPPHGASNGGEAAAIEFAVCALGVKDLIVCGHTNCGAITGLLDQQKLESMPAVKAWLQHAEATRRVVTENYPDLAFEDQVNVAIQENVLMQIENLKTLPAVASRLVRGDVRLHAWTYKFQTGQVFSYSAKDGQFLPATQVDYAQVVSRNRIAAATVTG